MRSPCFSRDYFPGSARRSSIHRRPRPHLSDPHLPRPPVRLDQTSAWTKHPTKSSRRPTAKQLQTRATSRRRMGTKGPWRQGQRRQELFLRRSAQRCETRTRRHERMTVATAPVSVQELVMTVRESARSSTAGPSGPDPRLRARSCFMRPCAHAGISLLGQGFRVRGGAVVVCLPWRPSAASAGPCWAC